MKLIFEGGDFGNKKCKRGYGGAYDRVYRILRFSGVWSLKSSGRFFVGGFGRNQASITVNMFS
jgi:hypothetical protein